MSWKINHCLFCTNINFTLLSSFQTISLHKRNWSIENIDVLNVLLLALRDLWFSFWFTFISSLVLCRRQVAASIRYYVNRALLFWSLYINSWDKKKNQVANAKNCSIYKFKHQQQVLSSTPLDYLLGSWQHNEHHEICKYSVLNCYFYLFWISLLQKASIIRATIVSALVPYFQ